MLPRVSIIDTENAKYMVFGGTDPVSTALFKTGSWQPVLMNITKYFCDGLSAPLVLDIGANIGAYSIPAAQYLSGKNGEVVSFEPQRIVYYQLCANIVLNRLDNLKVFNYVIGEKSETINIPEIDYTDNPNIGAFSLVEEARKSHGIDGFIKQETYPVQKMALDNISFGRTPSIIKIDVEGYELEVLKGGRSFLKNASYPPILFEASDQEWFKDTKVELIDTFAQMGYVVHPLINDDYIAQHPRHKRFTKFQVSKKSIVEE